MNQIALMLLALPIFGAILTPIGVFSRKLRNIALTSILLLSLTLNSYLLASSFNTNARIEIGIITVDSVSFLISEMILFLAILVVIYSASYMREKPLENLYFALLMLFFGAMIGLTMSFNLVILFAFLEASTASSALLILFSRTRAALKAACVYIALSIVGALLILIAIFELQSIAGTVNLLNPKLTSLSSAVKVNLCTLLLLGFGIKSGLVPFGLAWLPQAHSEAPTPISVTLSGILVQAVVFTLIRSVSLLGFYEPIIAYLLIGFGVCSAVIGVIFAFLEIRGVKIFMLSFRRDLKRILAFSTISEIGIIVFIAGVAPLYHAVSILNISLIHIIDHGLAKSLLFFSAGNIVFLLKTRDLAHMGGLARITPATAFSFLVGALSLSMMPPFLGFHTILEAFRMLDLAVVIILLLIALGTVIFYGITFHKAFLGRSLENPLKPPSLMIASTMICCLALLIISAFSFMGFIDPLMEKLFK
ncbi:MAG: proton-conducting transporter membrane subunit [Candidatus Bathyarchaeia archaeon]